MMCLKLRKSAQDVRVTSMAESETGKGENKGWDKHSIIHNKTEDTIVLRDMHRYVWRQVRMELKPNESKKISVKSPSTFFRMGAVLKVDERTQRDINVRIDTEQLVGRSKISICKDANGTYNVQEEYQEDVSSIRQLVTLPVISRVLIMQCIGKKRIF